MINDPNDPFGIGTYPAVGPPLTGASTGFPGGQGVGPPLSPLPSVPGMPLPAGGGYGFNPALQFMAPNGLPWATQPPTALSNPLIGKVNTGSATYPDPPQAPVNEQNQPTAPGTPQAPSDSASGQDFLSTVRDTIGSVARSALDIFGTGQYAVARPAYEALFHPQSVLQAGIETGQQIAQGTANLKTPFDIITRKFEEEQDPGIVKFIGEVAFDPLTYIGIGEVGLAARAAGKIPLAGHVLEPAVTAAGNYILLPSHAVQKAGDVIGPFLNKPATVEGPAQGFLNNFIPFHEAKDSAGKVLGSFLPSDTVKSILAAVPNEYTGIPIKVLSDPINSRYPKLGLPDVLKVPEVKDIKVAQSVMVAKDALVATMADYGVNPGMPNASDQKFIKGMIDDVYVKSPDLLSPHARLLQDLIKRPTPLGPASYDGVKRIIGGTAEYDAFKGLELNRIVSLYRRGPSIADPASGISESEAVARVASLMGADFTKNPDVGTDISRWLQGKGDESRLLRQRLGKMTPVDLITEMGIRSSNLTKGEWDLGIQVQRAQNNLFDQALNWTDNKYTVFWKDGFSKFIQQPLSGMYLNFALFTPWNVMETYLRGGMYGGGFTIRRVDNLAFAMENAAVKDVPPRLLQYTPSERAAVGLSQNVARKGAGPLKAIAELNPLDKVFERSNEIGNDWENYIQRNVWNKLLDNAIDNEHFVRGLTARSDFQAYYAAAKSPDVTAVPELAGLQQSLVNDVVKQSIKVVHSQDAIDSMKAAIDTGFFNREKMAGIIDGEGYQDLSASSKSIWYHGARAANTSSDFDNLITQIIDNEKAQALAAPTVIAQKFDGLASEIQKAGSMPGFDVTDLARALTHVHDMQTQFAGIPELIRQMEYDAIDRAQHQAGNGWRRAIHDEYNAKFQDSLNAVGKHLETANASLSQLGAKFGLQNEVDNFTTLLRADNQLTIDTWSKDLAFQQEFFAKMGKSRRMRATINWEDYYAERAKIWGEYYGQRELIRTEQVNTEAVIQQRIGATAAVNNGSIPSNASIAAAAPKLTPEAQALIDKGGVPTTMTNNLKRIARANGVSVTKNDTPNSIIDQLKAKSIPEVTPSAEIPQVEPGIDAAVKRVADGIDNGSDPEHIASGDYDSIINATRQGGTEPTTNVNRSTSGQTVSVTDPTQPIGSGSNGSSATVGTATPDITAGLWNAADSIRPRLEAEVQNVVNNPAMTQQHAKYLMAYIDNIKKEFESLSVPNQRTLTEVLESAGKRARQTFDNAFVDYDGRTKADWLMQHVFPFWMYESRRWPFLAKSALRQPGLAAIYSAYMHETNQGYIPIGELPLQVNPLRGSVLGSINRIQEQDRPLKYTEGLQGALDAIDATLGKVGLYAGPVVTIPSNIIRGAGGASTPPGLNTIVNIAHGSNLPVLSSVAGTIEQNMFPSPFRDYYTRMILASQKLEPDKVYEGALDGNAEMKAALDAAGRQADLVSVVLQQTGVLRFKTNEYSNYQEARMAAITDATGISREQQLQMQQQGTPLNQVAQLSPEQQDKLKAVEGTKEFNQISQPLLNPAAQRLRLAQRNFYDTLDQERVRLSSEQQGDDKRLQDGIISGVEWRKRYQARAGDLSTMFDTIRKLPEYDKIPVTPEQQAEARKTYNLPPYVDTPFSIALNEYYAVKPITDAVTGDVNWAAFFDERNNVLAKYPFLQDELDRKSREKDTVQVRDFKAASNTLRPYFEIKDQIIQRMPQLGADAQEAQLLTNLDPVQGRVYAQNNPNVQTLNKLVRFYQQQMRLSNPAVDRALVTYYGASPVAYQMMQSGGGPPTGLVKL